MITTLVVASSAYVATNPNTYRSLTGLKNVVQDVSNATINLVGAARERSSDKLWNSVVSAVKAPIHAADAVVYASAIIIPLPISRVWRLIRWQD